MVLSRDKKKLSALLRGITSKHNGDFYCLNCLHSFTRTNKLDHIKNMYQFFFFNFVMSSEDTKILEFNKHQKSDKVSLIIYADLECLIEKTDGCKSDPGNPSITKLG